MGRIFRVAVMAALVLAGGAASGAQAPGGQAGSSPAPQAVGSAGPSAAVPNAGAADTRTEKQKALARQTERLFDMASELKVQVDKTNKNILSMKVVREAEEIELLAKGMKEQAKR